MILVDTNVISELRKPRPHGGVLAWYARNPPPTLCLSAISVYELQAGAERTRNTDPAKAMELDRWIAELETLVRILPYGALEGKVTAVLLRHKPKELLQDAMIAATAVAYGLSIATRNTRDFQSFGVELVNPFDFGREPAA